MAGEAYFERVPGTSDARGRLLEEIAAELVLMIYITAMTTLPSTTMTIIATVALPTSMVMAPTLSSPPKTPTPTISTPKPSAPVAATVVAATPTPTDTIPGHGDT